MKGCDKISCLILLIIFPIVLSYSQTDQYKFRHLTTEDGLPINYCFQVLKDSQGFIWISTRAGLCRYDGDNIKVFQYDPLDSTSLSDNRISGYGCMVEDRNGYLWIGTTNGLNKYDPVTETFKRYKHKPDDPGSISNDNIYCVYKDVAGTLWASTSWTYGLNKYEPETDKFRIYKHNPDDSSFQIPTILDMLEDRKGILWLGTSRGVFQFDRESEVFIRMNIIEMPDIMNAKWIKKIFEDKDGTMFFGTPYGFLKYDSVKNEVKPFRPLYWEQNVLPFIDILEAPFEPERILWINAGAIMFTFDKLHETLTEINHYPMDKTGVLGASLSFFCDESGILWIPGCLGVNILNPGQIRSYTLPEFKEEFQYPNCFLEDHNGHLWIGTENQYLLRYDESMNLIKTYHSFPVTDKGKVFKGGFQYLYEDSDDNLWIGTRFNGIFLFEHDLEIPYQCRLPVSGQVWVYSIFEDSQGILWIGTSHGLFHHKKGDKPITQFYQDTTWPRLHNARILCINEDHKQNLWIGTAFGQFGLYRQPPELRGTNKFEKYKHEPGNRQSLSNNIVWCVHEDKFNNLWIGTENGLNKYIRDEGRFEQFINSADPGTNYIYDITSDEKGFLWLGTERGLVRYNPDLNKKNYKTGNNFKQILQPEDFVYYSMCKAKSGELIFGSSHNKGKGYYRFHPDSLYENCQLPTVAITQILVHNKELKSDSSLQFKKQILLKYNQNFFSFEFVALDYFDPTKNEYAYMLEGFDNDWTYSGNKRQARYTKVPPGSYIFRVKGSNSDGYWNEKDTSIMIRVLPPPWKTWWAYTIYGLFMIGLIIAWRKYDLKRLRLKQDLEIEQVEAEKLKELDTMKSRFFANISHEFRTPLTLILGHLQKVFSRTSDEETKQELNIMQRNARRLQNLINQLLDLSKLESGKMELIVKEENIAGLVKSYVQQFESMAKQKKIKLVFTSERDIIPVFVDKDKIEKILYNLLSNAFKFTGEGGRIEVAVGNLQSPVFSPQFAINGKVTADCQLPTTDCPGQEVVIQVSDTGQGIPPDKTEHIFDRFYQVNDSYTKDQEGTGIGLALTKELVELHHGIITVEDVLEKGTSFTVFLPTGKEHLKSGEIVDGVEVDESVEPIKDLPQSIEYDTEETIIDDNGVKDTKPLLLIVEDNSDLRSYIRSHLTKPYRIAEAVDGEMGLEKAIDKIPDLVISDVMMPKMNGYLLCRKIKEDERTSHIPVILLTAKAAMEDKLEGLETGADDFITKPFDPEELQTRINNLILQRKKLQDRFMKNIKRLGVIHFFDNEALNLTPIDQQFIQKATQIVLNNISSPDLDVELISSELFVSLRQLQRKMVAITGNSPNKFIRTIRLNRAAELLANKTGNVTEIAFEVGFNNLSWFAKSFKEQFGVLPSQYP